MTDNENKFGSMALTELLFKKLFFLFRYVTTKVTFTSAVLLSWSRNEILNLLPRYLDLPQTNHEE